MLFQIRIRTPDAIHNIYFPPQVNASFRCTYEETSDCILKQSIDDDDDWRLLPAGVDNSLGGFDHTSLSGKMCCSYYSTYYNCKQIDEFSFAFKFMIWYTSMHCSGSRWSMIFKSSIVISFPIGQTYFKPHRQKETSKDDMFMIFVLKWWGKALW